MMTIIIIYSFFYCCVVVTSYVDRFFLRLQSFSSAVFFLYIVSHYSLCHVYYFKSKMTKYQLHIRMAEIDSVTCRWCAVLPHSSLPDFYIASLPSLVRFCRAFPPLCDDAVSLLLQLGRIVHAHLATVNASAVGPFASLLLMLTVSLQGGRMWCSAFVE